MDIDDADRKILRELDFDSRQSYAQIADNIGRSKQFVAYRINRLTENNVIERYKIDYNIRSLGYTIFNVFLQFRGISEQEEQEIVSYLRDSSSVGYFFRTVGNWDVFLSVKSKDVSEFYSFVGELHKRFQESIKEEVINLEVRGANYYLKFLSDHRRPRENQAAKPAGEISQRDYRILSLLREDPLISNYALSKHFEESYNTIKRSVKQLRRQGTIKNARAVINHEEIGYERYLFLLDLLPGKKDIDQLRVFLREHPNTTYSIESVGRWSRVISVYIKSIDQLREINVEMRRLLGDSLRAIEYLRVYRSEKESFDVLEQ